MEMAAGCSWLAFRGRLQIRVSQELQFPEDILSSPKAGTEARCLCRIFRKASSSLHSDAGGWDEASWSPLPGWAGGDPHGERQDAAAALLHPSQHSLRSLRAPCESGGEHREAEGTASIYIELQNPERKPAV